MTPSRRWPSAILMVLLLGACGEARIALLPPDDAPDPPAPGSVAGAAAPEPSMRLDLEPGQAAPDALDPVEPGPGEPAPADPIATGEPETAPVGVASALLLHYDFEGTGEVVEDRVGTADGRILGGASLDGDGGLELDGRDDYVDMPNGILSGLEDVTISARVSWRGGACWQRIFDFGSTDAGEGQVGHATTSLFLTPSSCPDGVLTFMTERTSDKQTLMGPPMPNDRETHVTMVLAGATSQVSLYVDGELVATGTTQHAMQDLRDVNNWLGRSQWIQDGYLRARFEDLRIYGAALEPEQVDSLHRRVPFVY